MFFYNFKKIKYASFFIGSLVTMMSGQILIKNVSANFSCTFVLNTKNLSNVLETKDFFRQC